MNNRQSQYQAQAVMGSVSSIVETESCASKSIPQSHDHDTRPSAEVEYGVKEGKRLTWCFSPKRLDTPLGIHRVFTIPTYRSLGIAQLLLDAACRYTVYGCSFDPLKGQVAFSQPTNSGRGVMTKWGQGQVRVFVDDESQL